MSTLISRLHLLSLLFFPFSSPLSLISFLSSLEAIQITCSLRSSFSACPLVTLSNILVTGRSPPSARLLVRQPTPGLKPHPLQLSDPNISFVRNYYYEFSIHSSVIYSNIDLIQNYPFIYYHSGLISITINFQQYRSVNISDRAPLHFC